MADSHKNFAYSTVATAPSPATSGTSLVVATGDGAKFPAVPFNATIWPVSTQPSTTNAEIVRVTARSTDTLTITRTQESTSARTVVIGDQIVAGVTALTLDDYIAATIGTTKGDLIGFSASGTPIRHAVANNGQTLGGDSAQTDGLAWVDRAPGTGYTSGNYYPTPNGVQSTSATMTLNQLRVVPFRVDKRTTFDRIGVEVTATGTAGAVVRLGIYADNGAGGPAALVTDAGTVVGDSGTGLKTITISQTLDPGVYWLGAVQQTAVCTVRTTGPSNPFHYLLSTNAPNNYTSSVVDCLTVGSVTAGLPSPFGTIGNAGGGTGPYVFLRAV